MAFRNMALAAVSAALLLGASATATAGDDAKAQQLARGRYLVVIGGCNDCHTEGYAPAAGEVPESEWLKGSVIGNQGPWGTTYAANLRRVIGAQTEAQWLVHARKKRLPPMPWFALRQMTDDDLKAIYAYVRSLGVAGPPMPDYVAPGGKVTTPYMSYEVVADKGQAPAK